MFVYRQGAGHVEDTGRIMRQLVSPDGLTWSAPEVLYDAPEVDDRDPSAVTFGNGQVLISEFQYRRLTMGENRLSLHQIFTARSADGGMSFSPFEQVSVGPMDLHSAEIDAEGLWVDESGEPIWVWACSSPAVELGGRIIIPAYGGQALNLSNRSGAPRSVVALVASDDGGVHWTLETPSEPRVGAMAATSKGR